MNQVVKILTALGMIFSGIGQMLAQYNDIVQKAVPPSDNKCGKEGKEETCK